MSKGAELVARGLHDAYEALAPEYGYLQRNEDEKPEPWDNLPERYRDLLLAIIDRLIAEGTIVVFSAMEVRSGEILGKRGDTRFDGNPAGRAAGKAAQSRGCTVSAAPAFTAKERRAKGQGPSPADAKRTTAKDANDD